MSFFDQKKSSNGTAWKIAGGAALALVAAGVIVNFQDIKRYIRIVTM
jgi:hypothetical protein